MTLIWLPRSTASITTISSASLGSFPARGLVAAWLKTGVIDRGHFAPTERSSPQGGVISPVLMNVALHGMEEAAGVRYILCWGSNAGEAKAGLPGAGPLCRLMPTSA